MNEGFLLRRGVDLGGRHHAGKGLPELENEGRQDGEQWGSTSHLAEGGGL